LRLPLRIRFVKLRLNRRTFVASAIGSLASGIWCGCRSTRASSDSAATPRARGLTIIDTHTHFYDPARPQGLPWPPRDDPVLYRTVLPKSYLALATPQKVTGTVVVEASPWVEDNQWVLDLAAREPFIAGFVGNLPVGMREFAGHLQRFAANRLFRGIRIRDRKLDGTLEDAAFLSDLKRLAGLDLSLDLVGGAEILPFAERLARELPDLHIVIDHLAGVRIDGQVPPADWLRAMQALARRPKVYCKVSGLVEGTGQRGGKAPGDVEFYRPVLDAMWEMYGPDRLVYGSNWPVCEHFAPLATVQRIVSEYFHAKGRDAEEKVFGRNAAAVYRWVSRAAQAGQHSPARGAAWLAS